MYVLKTSMKTTIGIKRFLRKYSEKSKLLAGMYAVIWLGKRYYLQQPAMEMLKKNENKQLQQDNKQIHMWLGIIFLKYKPIYQRGDLYLIYRCERGSDEHCPHIPFSAFSRLLDS
ncbi:hypothetical protein TNCV_426271 [Trichonephila clavipes]|nr:hypothetical protein TNCV_426271 [Trichonephila clavipes]